MAEFEFRAEHRVTADSSQYLCTRRRIITEEVKRTVAASGLYIEKIVRSCEVCTAGKRGVGHYMNNVKSWTFI